MTREDLGHLLPGQESRRLFGLFRIRFKQVAAADQSQDAGTAGHFLGVADDVADARMRTAGDDEDSVPEAQRQGGIIQQEIRLPAVFGQPQTDGLLIFKRMPPGDLAEKPDVLADLARLL